MLKSALSVIAAMLLSVSLAMGASPELRSDHPDTYVVQPGDTLWDIASKFLRSPWLWPEIWQANPQLENPHLIYPGDVLSLVYVDVDGRREARVVKLSPSMRSESTQAIETIALRDVEQFLRRTRLLNEDEYRNLPYVVAVEDDYLRGIEGQNVYVRGLERLGEGAVVSGAEYAIVRPTVVYRDVPPHFPWETSRPRVIETEEWTSTGGTTLGDAWHALWKNRAYWATTELLGYEVLEIGSAQLITDGDAATMLLTKVDREVRAGDLVMPLAGIPFDLTFHPRVPDRIPDNMRVVAVADAIRNAGPGQVVALTRGARDGVETGQMYALYRPTRVVRDEIRYPKEDIKTLFRPSKTKVTLPEEFRGHVMVFRTFDRISYALVMDGIKPVELGDVLRAPR